MTETVDTAASECLQQGSDGAGRIANEAARGMRFMFVSDEPTKLSLENPHCGEGKTETMPTDACLFFWGLPELSCSAQTQTRRLLCFLLLWSGQVPACSEWCRQMANAALHGADLRGSFHCGQGTRDDGDERRRVVLGRSQSGHVGGPGQ